jgi:hypothetical protein
MPHFYEKNIVDIKNEYTTFLINIITPFIYEGLKSVYNYALEIHNKFLEREKVDPKTKSPGPLKIFQSCLKEIPTLNNHSIEKETNKIKEGCKCSEWFDDLVKAVIKSHIVLLTFTAGKQQQSEVVKAKYHERVDVKDFIHKCYIECARIFYNYPDLFWHHYPTVEIKRNQREIYDIIKTAVHEAIRKSLPIKLILGEYLKNDYIEDDDYHVSEAKINEMRETVKADLQEPKEEKHEEVVYDPTNLLDNPQDNLAEVYGEGKEKLEKEKEDDKNDVVDLKDKLIDIQKKLEEGPKEEPKQEPQSQPQQTGGDRDDESDRDNRSRHSSRSSRSSGGNNNRRSQFLQQLEAEKSRRATPDITAMAKKYEQENKPAPPVMDEKKTNFFAQYMK